ncbi:MAG: alkene reductase [Zoogloeaceae bacterium]|jgi:2,4-dienoyl-CoA reductase-like NADH-dependent reductase (Old Yellow Enzyme family)|nr:alkene reductase [Zoogloeaceae bacterium]
MSIPSLFDPLQLGDLLLPNRIVMAPMTRCRAAGNIPSDIMAEYYRLRAEAGLIISEGVPISPQAIGYPNVPGIWTQEQVEGWRLVTDAVHQAGGRIFAQLWHVGRVSDPLYLNGERPVAPSAIAAPGHVSLLRPPKPYVTPRALETNEIADIVEAFRRAARNAQLAQFDGVEIHAANGYLIDQFLHDSANQRTDDYGGSIENRARLLLEVTDAAISVWGTGRVGVHLSPRCDSNGMGNRSPAATFVHVAQALGQRNVAFIFTREAQGPGLLGPQLKRAFGGNLIANQGLDKKTGVRILAAGEADAIAFGIPFIANADLVQRLKNDLPFRAPRPEFFYIGGGEGYL